MPLLVGIDGGATRTRAVAATPAGEVVGVGIGGGCCVGATPPEQIERELGVAVRATLDGRKARTIFVGMAGGVLEEDRREVGRLTALVAGRGTPVEVDHDIRIALAGGLEGREGIVLIGGTGSSCYGRREDGRSWQAGGWGHLVDDFGGGYRIALDGLMAAVQGADGRSPETRLTARLFDALGIAELPWIIRRLLLETPSGERRAMSKDELAALATVVIEAAEEGDGAATEILDRAAGDLAAMVGAVYDRLGWNGAEAALVTAGSLVRCEAMAGRLELRLRREIRLEEPALPPAAGAVLLAAQAAGVTAGAEFVARLKATLPPMR